VGDFVDDVPPGSVIALDNRGRDDVTVWALIRLRTTDPRHLRT
jgi:hypothetical protein